MCETSVRVWLEVYIPKKNDHLLSLLLDAISNTSLSVTCHLTTGTIFMKNQFTNHLAVGASPPL